MELTGQDTYDIIVNELGINIRFIAIYDGHGIKGYEAATLAKEEIHKYLIMERKVVQSLSNRKEVETYFHKMYTKIQSKFRKDQLNYELSGTCAIAVLIIGNQCYVINMGDSRAVIGALKKGEQRVAYQMSIDHKPERADEKERIEKNGGYINTDPPNTISAYRVFSKNDDGPGLGVSRCFGDLVAHSIGVSNVPEVSYKNLEKQDMFIVIGSDGVWSVMNSPEVVGFIFEKSALIPIENRQVVVEELVKECKFRWNEINKYKEKMIYERACNQLKTSGVKPMSIKKNRDDITAIICFFTILLEEEK